MDAIMDWLRLNDRAYSIVLVFMLIGSFGGAVYLGVALSSLILP
jgi:hypothetical protein